MDKHNGIDHELTAIHQRGHGLPGGRLAFPEDAQESTRSREESPSLSRSDQSIVETSHDGDKPTPPQGLGNYFRIFTFCDRIDIALYIVGIAASIGSGITLPLMAVLFGEFTTTFTQSTSSDSFRSEVNAQVLLLLYLFIGRLVLTYVANLSVSLAALRITRVIRKRLLESTLRQEVWYFDGVRNVSIASQVTTSGDRINQGIADRLASIVQALAMFIAAFVTAFTITWKLTLITACVVPAALISLGVGVAFANKQETRITKIYSGASVLAEESLGSIRTIFAFWAQGKILEQYNDCLAAARVQGNRKSPNSGTIACLQQLFPLAGTALAFWQGFQFYKRGEIEGAGTILSVVLLVTIGSSGMLQVLPHLEPVVNASTAATELFELMSRQSKLDPLSTHGLEPNQCAGNITFRQVDFAYPARPSVQVLRACDLSIPAGKTTAIVGASGCGKSTLVALLEQWYVAQSGQIFLDDKSLGLYNTKWLRSNIRLVQQESVLFRGSVFENVARGFVDAQRSLPVEEQIRLVKQACKSSNAHDFIEALPDKYSTQVGQGASMFSGGQKQRIAIARSIISDPKVLLLDEATSALDPKAELAVQDALRKVSENKTTLVIAHKISTIRNADSIAVMSNGRIVEQGTHVALLQNAGQYAALVRAQDLGKVREDNDTEKRIEKDSHRPAQVHEKAGESVDRADLQSLYADKSLLSCLRILLKEQNELYGLFALAVSASAVAGGAFPAQSLLFAQLIGVFTLPIDEGERRANFFAIMLFMVALVNGAAYFVLGYVSNLISQTSTQRYRSEILKLLLGQDLHFFDKPENSSGALVSKLTSIPAALQDLMSLTMFLILMLLFNLVASSTLAIAYGWKLGLIIVFTGMPILVGCGYARFRFERDLEKKNSEKFAASAALAHEAVTNIRTVASMTMETQVLDAYGAMLDDIAKLTIRSSAWTIFGLALSQSLELLLLALGFWYGAGLLASGEYDVTQFFVCFLAVFFGGQAAGQIFGYSMTLTAARSAVNYILKLRSLEPGVKDDITHAQDGPGDDCVISAEEVNFTYDQRRSVRVLKDFNIEILPGSHIACVGPSGCGKSTLVSLLERLYDPTTGVIRLNGHNVKNLSLRLCRATMSLVQQEPTLLEGSVRQNICLGLEIDPPDEEILKACQQANILDLITSLPQGLATRCGSKGLQFSGGQRQRIALARALIRKPQILLLDEATSALDTSSEREVQKSLDDASAGRTTVAIAHRLSTIRHADRIFVLEHGEIVEQGTHEELRRLGGTYDGMCLAQTLDGGGGAE